MSIEIPSNETLVEKLSFAGSLSLEFHKLHTSSPELAYAVTPVFFKDGEEFGRYDTLWTDVQDIYTPERMCQSIVDRFNVKLEELGDGPKLTYYDELYAIFRTRVIFASGVLQLI
jgi:hypothetical protein